MHPCNTDRLRLWPAVDHDPRHKHASTVSMRSSKAQPFQPAGPGSVRSSALGSAPVNLPTLPWPPAKIPASPAVRYDAARTWRTNPKRQPCPRGRARHEHHDPRAPDRLDRGAPRPAGTRRASRTATLQLQPWYRLADAEVTACFLLSDVEIWRAKPIEERLDDSSPAPERMLAEDLSLLYERLVAGKPCPQITSRTRRCGRRWCLLGALEGVDTGVGVMLRRHRNKFPALFTRLAQRGRQQHDVLVLNTVKSSNYPSCPGGHTPARCDNKPGLILPPLHHTLPRRSA
jgi:hypothetical protein